MEVYVVTFENRKSYKGVVKREYKFRAVIAYNRQK